MFAAALVYSQSFTGSIHCGPLAISFDQESKLDTLSMQAEIDQVVLPQHFKRLHPRLVAGKNLFEA
jgi:hypothetical protein